MSIQKSAKNIGKNQQEKRHKLQLPTYQVSFARRKEVLKGPVLTTTEA